jgi:hypothetical protein
MPILGLLSTESTGLPTERFTNIRRSVFYFYPNGAAPLIGLLSMLKEEDTNDPKFSYYEKRLSTQRVLTKTQGSSKGPFRLAADSGDGADPFLPVVLTTHTLYVDSNTMFRVGHVVKVGGLTNAGGTVTLGDYKAVVTSLGSANSPTATDRITIRPLSLPTGISTGFDNGTTLENVGKEVLIIGSSFTQGSTDVSSGIYNIPITVQNFCQIFRSPFSITGTALKTALKYDESGPYKDQAKETSVDHMREIEKAFIFGVKLEDLTSSSLPQHYTGGLLHFLEQWEVVDSVYRGGTGAPAVTADTDDNKRIIANTDGSMTHKRYNGYLERVFRVTNNTTNEKLVLCGSGFLSVINQMYEGRATLNASLPMTETFGMNVVRHETPFGTVLYKSHPLFSQNPILRNNALFIDIHNLVYRYVSGRDTTLLKNRQANDADFRKDEWLSECGLELRFPESCMYLQNVVDFVA